MPSFFRGQHRSSRFWLEELNPGWLLVMWSYLDRPVTEHGRGYSEPSVKQHLAAIRMLFDYLVTGGILPMNPASSVRGPKYTIKRGERNDIKIFPTLS